MRFDQFNPAKANAAIFLDLDRGLSPFVADRADW
jgi:hypothetical protein